MKLVKMKAEDFARFRENHLNAQAPDLARSFDLPLNEARTISAQQLDQMLPEDGNSPGNHFYTIVDEQGTPAGHLWFFVRDFFGKKKVFVADILVYKGFRRRGLGRFALGWLSSWACENGHDGMALHVFGSSTGARRLYEAIGFEPVSITMTKKLG